MFRSLIIGIQNLLLLFLAKVKWKKVRKVRIKRRKKENQSLYEKTGKDKEFHPSLSIDLDRAIKEGMTEDEFIDHEWELIRKRNELHRGEY